MSTPQDLTADFWSHLKSDRIVMLSTDGAPPRPMAAQTDDAPGPLWFFTAEGTDLGEAASARPRTAAMTFQSKGQEFWASVTGTLTMVHDPATVDRLWNPMIAAWFDGGQDDPQLRLLRFDAGEAELWGDASNLMVMAKAYLGGDVSEHLQGEKAHVDL
ncbi:MAG: pyridoxamine 5'-phosphate oxidase family protein [Parvularcula sp.]|jgi:general stress protein 26|nr:pyridoxamine 5'-phosphate oxidase family protein [Parvularcula sp.]